MVHTFEIIHTAFIFVSWLKLIREDQKGCVHATWGPFYFQYDVQITGPQSGESQTLWQHDVYSKAWKQKATALQRNTAALQDYVQKGLYVDNPQ